MPRNPRPTNWKAIADGIELPPGDEQHLWEERRAIEIERWAIEDAVARAVAHGEGKVSPPYQPEWTILDFPLLPALCTAAMMFVLAYLQSRP